MYNIVENLKLTLLLLLVYTLLYSNRLSSFSNSVFALVNVSSARSKKFLITRNVSMERYM